MTDAPKIGAPFEAQFSQDRLQDFTIKRLIRMIHTADLVKVLAVYPTAGTVGFVDVQPLVQERTTRNVVIAQAPIYRLPYLRLQGGTSAIVLDPVVGDLGIAVFAERDITNAIKTRAEGAAPTDRAYDAGDGLYLGGFLNADPAQYVRFDPEGGIEVVSTGDLLLQAAGAITLTAGGAVTINATGLQVNCPAAFTGTVTAPEAVVGGIPYTTHRHPNGSPNTGTPIV